MAQFPRPSRISNLIIPAIVFAGLALMTTTARAQCETCCIGRVGDVNANGDDEPTISDVSVLIDALYISHSVGLIACPAEADVNRSAAEHPCEVAFDDLTIGDVSYLIDYLFITGSSLGLADCVDDSPALPYPIVETGQTLCYDETGVIPSPSPGEPFYGQDAQYVTNECDYVDNGDGTITDNVTGLMWQKSPELYNLKSWDDAMAEAGSFDLAGYTDWRLPTIKELYSLIRFTGSSFDLVPYLDTDYFDFRFGDESLGERVIDAQYWSSTEYVGLTMNGDETVFGVNFADGRIKGYPKVEPQTALPMERFVRYVRGGNNYGVNDFVDNGDGTITDLATGLMWQKTDDGLTLNWEDALAYAESLELAGYTDWRLPDAKQLQSIVDYTRAPDALAPSPQGAAIDPLFDISDEEGWFWTGTTLNEAPPETGWGTEGVYVAFGRATGWMEVPPGSGNYNLWNVHGAGAQRGDPKDGNPDDYPYGFGPQGDVIRILNYVRCVRTVD